MIHGLERHPQHCCTSGVYYIGKDISCGVQQSNSHLCIVSKENKGGKEGRKGRKEGRKEGRLGRVWLPTFGVLSPSPHIKENKRR